jgi:hypothetical protein
MCNGDSVGGTMGIGFSMQTIVKQNEEEVSDGIRGMVLKELVHGSKLALQDLVCSSRDSVQTLLNIRKVVVWRSESGWGWSPARGLGPVQVMVGWWSRNGRMTPIRLGLGSSSAFLVFEQTIFPGFGVGFEVEFSKSEFIPVN